MKVRSDRADPGPEHDATPRTSTARARNDVPAEGTRRANGYDHVSFALQLVQVVPLTVSVLGILMRGQWLLYAASGLLLIATWILAEVLSRQERPFTRRPGAYGPPDPGPAAPAAPDGSEEEFEESDLDQYEW